VITERVLVAPLHLSLFSPGAPLDALRSIPGATGSALSMAMPGTGEEYPTAFTIDNRNHGGLKTFADSQAVSPGYFQLMGIPILAGETCRISFEAKSLDHALVNRAFAERYFAGENPMGHHLGLGYSQPEIIGITGDVREHGYAKEPTPTIYWCGYPGFVPDPLYMVKTAVAPAHIVEACGKRCRLSNRTVRL
jgi:hypothetical protein